MNEIKKELILTRTLDASREAVWKAWTDQTSIAEWWGPNGVTNPTCEWDARVGGALHIVMLAGEELGPLKGQEWPMRGSFTEVTAPEKLVFIGGALAKDDDKEPFLESTTTVTFQDDGGKTTMTVHILVTKAGPEAEGPLSGMEMGWNQQLDKLAVFLKK